MVKQVKVSDMEEDKLDLPEEELTARVNMYVSILERIWDYFIVRNGIVKLWKIVAWNCNAIHFQDPIVNTVSTVRSLSVSTETIEGFLELG